MATKYPQKADEQRWNKIWAFVFINHAGASTNRGDPESQQGRRRRIHRKSNALTTEPLPVTDRTLRSKQGSPGAGQPPPPDG